MANHRVVHGLFRQSLVHKVDSPARRVHLLAEEDVRRASRQTKATMDAVVYEVLLWRVMVIEGRKGVATALGPVIPHGMLERVRGCGESALANILWASGAYGTSHRLFSRGTRLVVLPLGAHGRVVAVARLPGVRSILLGHLDASYEPARVQDTPGIDLLLYPARQAEVVSCRPPYVEPLFDRGRGIAHYHVPTPPYPDLPELLNSLHSRLLIATRKSNIGNP